MTPETLNKFINEIENDLGNMTADERAACVFEKHMKMLVTLTQAMGLVTCAANKKLNKWLPISDLVRDDIIKWLSEEGRIETLASNADQDFRIDLAADLVIKVRDFTEKRLGFS